MAVCCIQQGAALCRILRLPRDFPVTIRKTQQEPRLRRLTTLFWLLFPAFALAAPHTAVRLRPDGSGGARLMAISYCSRHISVRDGVGHSLPMLRRSARGHDIPVRRMHRGRQLAAVADTHALFLEQQYVASRASDLPPFFCPLYLPGRSPPSC